MALTTHLLEQFEHNASGLSGVTRRKMFGCECFFRDGTMFGLIWKDGRIGLKFPDDATFKEASALAGADPWSPGGAAKMKSWVLVPEGFHDDDDALAQWIRRSHALTSAKPVKEKPAKKKPAKKKPAKK